MDSPIPIYGRVPSYDFERDISDRAQLGSLANYESQQHLTLQDALGSGLQYELEERLKAPKHVVKELPEVPRSKSGLFAIIIQDTWALELMAILFSIIFLLAIVAILWYYRGHHMPVVFPYHVELGSIISILATGISSLIVVPLSSGLGQMMWIKLQTQSTPLVKLDILDYASRGVTGGVALLFHRKTGYKEVLASIAWILTLGLGPTIQATLSTVELKNTAILKRCTKIANPSLNPGGIMYDQYEATLWSSDYDPKPASDQTLQELNQNCTTGDCDWPIFSSLALCSDSTDITANISINCTNDSCDYSLPNGLSLQNIKETSSSISNGSTSLPTINYQHWGQYPMATYSIISRHGLPNHFHTAAEGVLFWCIRGYNSSVKNNVLTQNITTTWYDKNVLPPTKDSPMVLSPPQDTWSLLNLSSAANFTVPFEFTWFNTTLDFKTTDVELRQIVWNNVTDIPSMFDFITSSMSNRLRSSVCNDTVIGTGNKVDTVLRVQWLWLILPVINVLLTTAFLAIIMIQSHHRRVKLWKNSILAVLFHGVSMNTRCHYHMAEADNLTSMENVAENVVVALRRQRGGTDEDGLLLRCTNE